MNNAAFRLGAIILTIWIYLTGSVFAGQVVTQELSDWAKGAIANEQALTAAPASKSIAVLYFQNLTGKATFDPLQKGLAVMLMTDLAKVEDIQVVERARLQAILEEIELGTTGLVDRETAPRIGRLVGARFLSGGDLLKGSVTQLQVDPNLLDVSEQFMVNQAGAEGDLNDLIAIEKEILFDIILQMGVVLTLDQKAELEKPLSTSIAALMLLFKGIDASDHGQYSQAAELYEQALAQDPNLTPAKEALNELKALELTSQSAEVAQAKQPASSPEPVATAAKSGGFLKYTAIGLGVAAAGAGGFYLATADKDDDNGTSPPPPTDRPAVVSTNPDNGASGVSDSLREIRVEFNMSMNTNANVGQIVTQAVDWQVPGAAVKDWQSDRVMIIRRLKENQLPQGGVAITLQGFQNSDSQNMDTYNISFSVSSGIITPDPSDVIFRW